MTPLPPASPEWVLFHASSIEGREYGSGLMVNAGFGNSGGSSGSLQTQVNLLRHLVKNLQSSPESTPVGFKDHAKARSPLDTTLWKWRKVDFSHTYRTVYMTAALFASSSRLRLMVVKDKISGPTTRAFYTVVSDCRHNLHQASRPQDHFFNDRQKVLNHCGQRSLG